MSQKNWKNLLRNYSLSLLILLIFLLWGFFWIQHFPSVWWDSSDLYWLFYISLVLPWVILLLFLGFEMIKLNSTLTSKEDVSKNLLQPLNIRGGIVRLFLIFTVGTVFLYYLVLQKNDPQFLIPSSLLIIINVIIAYFGFKPREVLPENYVYENLPSEMPKNINLINNLPRMRSVLMRFELGITKSILNMKEGHMAVDKVLEDIKSKLEEVTKIKKNIPSPTGFKDPYDIYGYFAILIGIALANLIISPDIPSSYTIPLFAGGGIAAGYLIRNKMNSTVSWEIAPHLKNIQKTLNGIQTGLTDKTMDVTQAMGIMETSLENFKEGNFLASLPPSISALLSIGAVSLLALYAFVVSPPIPEAIFNTIQWFVLYYFTTKN